MGIIKVGYSCKIRELDNLSLGEVLWEVERREAMLHMWDELYWDGRKYIFEKFQLSDAKVEEIFNANRKKKKNYRKHTSSYLIPSLILNIVLFIFLICACLWSLW